MLTLQQLALQGRKNLRKASKDEVLIPELCCFRSCLRLSLQSASLVARSLLPPYLQPPWVSLGDQAPPLASPLPASYCHSEQNFRSYHVTLKMEVTCQRRQKTETLITSKSQPNNACLLLILVKVKRVNPCK
jgi:hypothetical protein